MPDSKFAPGDRVVKRGDMHPVFEVTRSGTSWPYVHLRHVPTEYQIDCLLEDDLVLAPPAALLGLDPGGREAALAGALLEMVETFGPRPEGIGADEMTRALDRARQELARQNAIMGRLASPSQPETEGN